MDTEKSYPVTELMIERMECYRQELALTQSEFAAELGLTLSGYKKILNCSVNSIKKARYEKLLHITNKVFWAAYPHGEPYISIADAFDAYEYDIGFKLSLYHEICKPILERLPDEKEIHSIIAGIKKSGKIITSSSFAAILRISKHNRKVDPGPIPIIQLSGTGTEDKNSRQCFQSHQKDVLDRIEYFRVREGFSQKQFAHEIGYSLSGYKKLLSKDGSSIPTDKWLHAGLILNAISLTTPYMEKELDEIAFALDHYQGDFEVKWSIFSVLAKIHEEFGLTQEKLDKVLEIIYRPGDDYEQFIWFYQTYP